MYEECRHIMPSGRKCHSPALSGKAWCYYHQNLHRYGKPARFNDNFAVFSIEDARGIQIALTQVLAAAQSPLMERRRLGLMLYGLQLATQLLKHTAEAPEPAETVRELHDLAGAPIDPDALPASQPDPQFLAPGKSTCEPPRDCRNCPRQDSCENYEEPPEEEEDDYEEEDVEDDGQDEDEDCDEEDDEDEEEDDETDGDAENDKYRDGELAIKAALRTLRKDHVALKAGLPALLKYRRNCPDPEDHASSQGNAPADSARGA